MQLIKQKHRLNDKSRDQAKDLTQNGILVIGEVSKWVADGRSLPQSSEVHCIEFYELTESILDLLKPSAVFSPLLCASFDCMDVAFVLQGTGYQGRYRAVSEGLPNPKLIQAEINQTYPNIDFYIVNLGSGLRTN